MLREEAIWFGERLGHILSLGASPVLNVGSSTKHFRSVIQPQIDQFIFNPLEQQGIKLVHLDQKNAEGVDIVGDLSDPAFLEKVKGMECKTIFCNNLLMHLDEKDRLNLVEVFDKILPSGGLIYLSTSFSFPYTPDPYDSYYRPDPLDLASLFPRYSILDKKIVEGSGSLYKSVTKKPRFGMLILARIFTPFYKFRSWKYLIQYLPKFFNRYSASCIIIKKD